MNRRSLRTMKVGSFASFVCFAGYFRKEQFSEITSQVVSGMYFLPAYGHY